MFVAWSSDTGRWLDFQGSETQRQIKGQRIGIEADKNPQLGAYVSEINLQLNTCRQSAP